MVLQPAAWYIDFGLDSTIQEFFMDPEWCEARKEMDGCWVDPAPGSYYASEEGQRMYEVSAACVRGGRLVTMRVGQPSNRCHTSRCGILTCLPV